MTKKEFLIKILSIIGKKRALAQAIKVLVESNELNDTFTDKLVQMMNEFVSKITDIQKKKVIKEGINIIKKLQQVEVKEKEIDKKDMDQLENLLNTIT